MLCHDSPKESQESHQTFRDSSREAKRRRPQKWQIELIENVTWWSRKIRTAPPQKSPAKKPYQPPISSQPTTAGSGERDDHERQEELRDHAQAAVAHQILRVARLLGAAGGREEPAGVGVPEPAQRADDAVAVADVRAVRVALLVGELVVLAVVGDPGEHVTFDGHLAEHGERVAHAAGRSRTTGG